MTLVDRWIKISGRAWDRMPTAAHAILIPWILIGIVVAIVPDMQQMPGAIRLIIGLPAALGMLWMATGFFLSLADKLIGVVSFVSRGKAR